MMMGVFALSSVLSRPWISEMIDRIGRKKSYTFGCLFMGLLPLLYLQFKGDLSSFYYPLMLVRLLHGVGLSLCLTAPSTYIADIIPHGRLNEGIGTFGAFSLMGMAVGPAISDILIKQYGFSVFFISAGALGILGLLIHLPLAESYRHGAKKRSASFFSILMKRKVMMIALLALLFGFGLSAYGGFVSPFAKEKQIQHISIYFIAYALAALFARVIGGKIGDRIGEARILPYALALTGSGLLIMLFLGGVWILVISGLMTGSGHGLLFPCLNALAIRNESIEIRGKMIGIFTGGIDAGIFSGSIILGYIGEWGGFHAIFLVAGLALFIGLGLHKLVGRAGK